MRARTSSDLVAPIARAELVGELAVARAGELAADEREALALGQAADLGDDAGELLARLGAGGRVAVGGGATSERRSSPSVGRSRRAQVVEGAVADDHVEPGAQRHRAVAGAQGGEARG